MDKTSLRKIEKYLKQISEICNIEEAYIFGSSVHSKNIKKSDIDLALISKTFNEENFIDFLSQFLIISAANDLNIEPHLFNPEDSKEEFVKQEVISKGIRIAPAAWH